ncbi:hypothetical protein IWQ49_000913 [Labrenzia sp. EL_126]|nr:hypothetical protein [Labrenzia sp. EL_126]
MSGTSFKRMEGKLVDIVRQSWKTSMPEKEMVAACIMEGVRQAFSEHLSGNPLTVPEGLPKYRTKAEQSADEKALIDNVHRVAKTALVAPPVRPPAPAHAATTKTLPSAVAAPVSGIYTVVSSAKHGPTRSSDQVYITFRLKADNGQTLWLKFYWSGTGETKVNWELLFAAFLRRCGVEKITDTDQLHGRKIYLNVGARTKTLAGMDSVSNALGYQL